MGNMICPKTKDTVYRNYSECSDSVYKRISLCFFRIVSPLLIVVTPSALTQTAILTQTGTYTLTGPGPFILSAPHTVTAPDSVGITSDNTANWQLTIENGAMVNAKHGIFLNSLDGGSVLNNAGTIISNVDGAAGSSYGVRLEARGTINNLSTGLIDSQSDGIFLANGGTVNNDGSIQGVYHKTAVYFNSGEGVYIGNASSTLRGGYGVIVNAGNSEIINAGKMNVDSRGVWFRGNSSGKLINQQGGSITVPGTASTQYGVVISGSGAVQFENEGEIVGGTGVLFNTDNHIFTNSGSVMGSAGDAVSIWGNNNALILTQGSLLDGAIVSTGSGNTLTLRDSGRLTGNFSGLERVVVEAGSDRSWILEGSSMGTTAPDAAALNVKSGALILKGGLTHTGVGGGTSIALGASLWIHPPGEVNGDIANDGALAFVYDRDLTFAGKISGAGSLLKDDGGALLLTNPDSSYTGKTTVNAGTLRAGAVNIIDDSSMLSLSANGVFDLNGFEQRANNLLGDGAVHLTDATLTVNQTMNTLFSGVIDGSGAFTKTGDGLLVLAGDHTYTGITTIDGGALQLGDRGTSGSIVSDVVNNGALVFNRSDEYAYGGVISGSGDVAQSGSGVVRFSQEQTYTGATDVYTGTLLLDNGARLSGGGVTTTHLSGTLGGYGGVAGDIVNRGVLAIANAAPGFIGGPDGHFAVGGSLTNSGEIRIAGSQPASVLSIGGDYVGDNGALTLNTQLGDDNSKTDRLTVGGDTRGLTHVTIHNTGGTGAQTVNGIEIISVAGRSDGQFSLARRVTAGAYEYELHQGGVGASAGNGNWYLRTLAAPRPESGVYLRNLSVGNTMFMHTMRDRLGEQASIDAYRKETSTPSAWVRLVAKRIDGSAADGQIDLSTDSTLVHIGGDLARWTASGTDRWHAGVMGAFGKNSTDADVVHQSTTPSGHRRSASGDIDGYSAGAYLTWFGQQEGLTGPYVDVWGQYAWYDNSVQGNGQKEENYDSHGWTFSAESGYTFSLGENRNRQWLIEPQAQVAYNGYRTDDHREANGTRVQGGDIDGVVTRLGVRLYSRSLSESSGVLPFIEGNWWYDDAQYALDFNDEAVDDDTPYNTFELKVGLQGEIAGGWQVWGHVSGRGGEDEYRNYGGMLGVKKRF